MSRSTTPDGDLLDPLVVHARRETLVILVVFAVCLVWSVGCCHWLGYPEPIDGQVVKLFGIPAWVFWGVVVPWLTADVFAIWFCFFFMADDPLVGSEDPEAAEDRNA